MGPRLLAYGGVRFSERRRIGEWPPIPEGTLRDPYGLQTSCWSFGAGTAGGTAFLILRRLQRFDSRVYAFTLLLDPGERVWKRFEWNGAAIIDALLQTEPEIGGSLFASPEDCTESALEQIVDALQPGSQAGGAGADRFSAMLAGSAGLDDALVVSPAGLGLSERPQCAAVAQSLQKVPPCFRLSQGWLVGGGSLHGDVLGARFVIDDAADGIGSAGFDAESKGRRYVAAWNDVGETSLLEPLAGAPLFAWPVHAGIALDAVTLLSDLRGAEELSDGLLIRLKGRTSVFPALDSAIDQRKVELLLNGNGPLAPPQTLELTETALTLSFTLDERQTSRLHGPTLIAYLTKRYNSPSAIPRTFAIPRDVRLALWEWAIEHATDGDVNSMFSQAADAEPSDAEIARLVAAANRALAATDTSLIPWAKFQTKSRLWHHLEEPLRLTALQRLQHGAPGAAEDYLHIADDPGGLIANSLLRSPDLAISLVRGIWKLQRKHARLVRVWIEKLAESPLRARLPLDLKEEFLGHDGWQNLATLKQILAGDKIAKDSLQASPAEQEFLAAELRQMPAPLKIPKTVDGRLRKLLGGYWQGIAEQPETVEPSLEPASPAVEQQYSSEPFVRIFRRLLFEPPAGDDALLAAVNELRAARELAEPADAMEQAGALVLNAPADATGPFLERFGRQYIQLGNIMDHLPADAQERLIQLLDGNAKGKFASHAIQDLKHALERPGSRNSYSDALGRYVLHQPELLKKIAGRMGDMEPAALARSIKEMIARRQTK